MSLHTCPIEPDDWSNGNGDREDCPDCEGTGTVVGDDDEDQTCLKCHGSGVLEPPEYDEDDL